MGLGATTPIIVNGYYSPNNQDNVVYGFSFQSCERRVLSLSQIFQMIRFPNLGEARQLEIKRLQNHLAIKKRDYEFEIEMLGSGDYSDSDRFIAASEEHRTAQRALHDYEQELQKHAIDYIELAVFNSSLGYIGFKLSFDQAAALAPLSNSKVIEIDNTDWQAPKIILRDPKTMLRPKAVNKPQKLKIG